MARIPHPCVTISACLAGALLLLPLCLGYQYEFDYDSPEYSDNSSIEYSFFSNGSTEELEKFILGGGTDTGGDTSVTEKDESVREVKPTETTILNQASRLTPVYLLLTLVMMVYQLLRLL
ncbi:uncharacterized protein si:ch211-191i18.2 [Triplophysa dalaica]|uniref:uncharacterized protein si:ch211-191i18.2 n=1 Tax=Triplophysa dalaica TaxID=1582913 RepID=UPI0024DFD62A|nr:uncharacterized protein si:ch211-191i18.2 [Triplophysa dalaica]